MTTGTKNTIYTFYTDRVHHAEPRTHVIPSWFAQTNTTISPTIQTVPRDKIHDKYSTLDLETYTLLLSLDMYTLAFK